MSNALLHPGVLKIVESTFFNAAYGDIDDFESIHHDGNSLCYTGINFYYA